jgi:long-chain fatty acid transport protein
MKKILILGLFSLVLAGLAPFVHGSGFLIYEHGASAMAMGGAFVSIANNASAIFHNPAGIAFLNGTQIYTGTTLITSKGSLSLPNWPDSKFKTVKQESQWFYPSTFYISHRFSDRVAAGFGFFSPYGLGAKWPKDYPLRFISTRDDMKTFFFNPAIALKLSENFSLGFGVSYIYSTIGFDLVELVDLSKLNPFLKSYEVPINLKANGDSWGFNAGALYKGENFSFGLNWRSGFKIKFEGDLALDTANIPAVVRSLFPTEGTAETSFNFPHILGAGASFNLAPNFLLSADVQYILWSSYDKYTVKVGVPGFADKEVEENWKDSFIFRGGFEYKVNENFALRAGVLHDQTPQPEESVDPVLPDAKRWALTGGFGYKIGYFVLDLAYQLELFSDRKSPNRNIPAYYHPLLGNLGEGTYSTTAHLIGISLGFVF